MTKKWSLPFLFFGFCILFSGLLFQFHSEAVLSGVIYSFVYAFRFRQDLKLKEAFPILMLFLFLMILIETPERAFTFTLIYTVRVLIVFRGLLLLLVRIQNLKAKVPNSDLISVLGLTTELAIVSTFLYACFKFVDPSILHRLHFLSLKVFLICSIPLIFQSFRSSDR